MLTFYLWNVPGLSLLIPAKSGIRYANQTGGHHCSEQELEGYLLPLCISSAEFDQEKTVSGHFVAKWGGWCGPDEGIDEATADFVDNVFLASPHTDWLRVERSRLRESHEAWVVVRPGVIRATEIIEFGDFAFEAGVITWRNSD